LGSTVAKGGDGDEDDEEKEEEQAPLSLAKATGRAEDATLSTERGRSKRAKRARTNMLGRVRSSRHRLLGTLIEKKYPVGPSGS
jgi:hypothetical protein